MSTPADRREARIARAETMVARRVAGDTLEVIGRDYGLTRERVRQITEKYAPWRPWDAAAAERQTLQADVDQVRAALRTCRICGGQLPARRHRLCSDDCHDTWALLRYHLADDRYRRKARRSYARWASTHRPEVRGYAERVLAADGGSLNPDRRWVCPSSRTWQRLRDAVVGGWPIVGELDPVVVGQVRAALEDGRDLHRVPADHQQQHGGA